LTCRGNFLLPEHRLHRLYRLSGGHLDELSRSGLHLAALSAANSRQSIIAKAVKVVKVVLRPKSAAARQGLSGLTIIHGAWKSGAHGQTYLRLPGQPALASSFGRKRS
jgi:hypothetical protein